MKLKHKFASVALAGLLAVPLLGFAPVPNTTVYHGQYLFAEDGAQTDTRVSGHTYEVASLFTLPVKNLDDANPHYRAAIIVLDKRGKILYFRQMSEARMVNAYGRYTEVKHKYASLAQLEARLNALIKHAPNHY